MIIRIGIRSLGILLSPQLLLILVRRVLDQRRPLDQVRLSDLRESPEQLSLLLGFGLGRRVCALGGSLVPEKSAEHAGGLLGYAVEIAADVAEKVASDLPASGSSGVRAAGGRNQLGVRVLALQHAAGRRLRRRSLRVAEILRKIYIRS